MLFGVRFGHFLVFSNLASDFPEIDLDSWFGQFKVDFLPFFFAYFRIWILLKVKHFCLPFSADLCKDFTDSVYPLGSYLWHRSFLIGTLISILIFFFDFLYEIDLNITFHSFEHRWVSTQATLPYSSNLALSWSCSTNSCFVYSSHP